MPAPSPVKMFSSVQSLQLLFVYILARWGQEGFLLSLPPSTATSTRCIKRILSGLSNNPLEATETDLIRVLINLSPQAKQSQEAKWKGAGFFSLPQDTLLSRELGPTVCSGELTFSWRKFRDFTFTLNNVHMKLPQGLAFPWLITTLKACCSSSILAVFQNSWQIEKKHTAVAPPALPTRPPPTPWQPLSTHTVPRESDTLSE